MMSELEVRETLAKLIDRMSNVETEIRVVKHDLSNMQQSAINLASKLEKVEDRLGSKVDALSAEIAAKFQTLSTDIAAINVKHERGMGFFAGVGSVFAIVGGLLLTLAKFLFAGGSS